MFSGDIRKAVKASRDIVARASGLDSGVEGGAVEVGFDEQYLWKMYLMCSSVASDYTEKDY